MHAVNRVVFAALTLIASSPAVHAQQLHLLYVFGRNANDGRQPYAPVTYHNGMLFGTTFHGGTKRAGTAFVFNMANGTDTILQNFSPWNSPDSGLIYQAPYFYGSSPQRTVGHRTDPGAVFRISFRTGHRSLLHQFTGGADGANPQGSLVFVNGVLYGTATAGGATGNGTLFGINPSTKDFSLIWSFAGGADGSQPMGVIYQSGTYYGTTYAGGGTGCGGAGCGTVFAINAATGAEQILYAFQGGADGANPVSNPIYQAGILYGTTTQGGDSTCQEAGCGTVFAVNTATGAETVLHKFAGGVDGSDPAAPVLFRAGRLFGTTVDGGNLGFGTIFSVDATTGQETVQHTFVPTEGENPRAGLIFHHGIFYGTTSAGLGGVGTLFQFVLN